MNQVPAALTPTELLAASQPGGQELLAEIDLGSARGGRKPEAPLSIEVVRALGEADLPAITAPPSVSAPPQTISRLKHSHHRLAQLIAEGKPGVLVSQITGYSQAYISTLQNDPTFEELVQYYSSQRESIFEDATQRLKVLGLDATEKLQEMLHDQARQWSPRELMELVEMTGVNAEAQAAKNAKGSGGVTINTGSAPLEIKFVAPQQPTGPMIDVTPGG